MNMLFVRGKIIGPISEENILNKRILSFTLATHDFTIHIQTKDSLALYLASLPLLTGMTVMIYGSHTVEENKSIIQAKYVAIDEYENK